MRAAVARLKARGVEAIAIHFLHSYANPAHERARREIVRSRVAQRLRDGRLEILPEIREFERGTTAALNAYVQPIIARLCRAAGATRSRRGGFADELLIMQGNGGMMAASVAREHAVQTVLSGPAAGAIGRRARSARRAGIAERHHAATWAGPASTSRVIRDGVPAISARRTSPTAIPLRMPMIDIHTIGAGGGSIARINAGGLLQVGPRKRRRRARARSATAAAAPSRR